MNQGWGSFLQECAQKRLGLRLKLRLRLKVRLTLRLGLKLRLGSAIFEFGA